MKNKSGSALLVVLTVMTGLTLLLTSWWQATGWAGDLVFIRQQYISRFYATEVVLNYGLAWAKKNFDRVNKSSGPIVLNGGTVHIGAGVMGRSSVIIDRVLNMVRVTATLVVDNKKVACHRCLLGHDIKGKCFVVHHFSFSSNS